MNRPPEPPPAYGALIEAAREAAGLSRREAARRAGISDAWWRYVVQGWQNGPISGAADTVAKMARVVGVTPDELETEGQRADAARVLREVLSAEPPAGAASGKPFTPGAAWDENDPRDDAAARLFRGDTRHDRMIRNIWRLGEAYGTSELKRIDMIEVVDPELAALLRRMGGQSEAGLQCAPQSHVQCNESVTSGLSGYHRTVPVRDN